MCEVLYSECSIECFGRSSSRPRSSDKALLTCYNFKLLKLVVTLDCIVHLLCTYEQFISLILNRNRCFGPDEKKLRWLVMVSVKGHLMFFKYIIG